MPSIRLIQTWLLAIILVSPLALAAKKRSPDRPDVTQQDEYQFQRLLDQVPEENLHEALHSLHPAFKDGIFESDRPAAEAVHDEDPALASHVATTAAQMKSLRKRQVDNSTSTPNSPSSYNPPTPQTPSSYATPSFSPGTSSPPSYKSPSPSSDLPSYPEPTPSDDSSDTDSSEPSQGSSGGGSGNRPAPSPSKEYSAPPDVIVPFSKTTTDDEGRKYVTEGQNTAAITGHAVVPITTTDENGNRITTSTSVPGLVFHTTDAEGNERATTSPLPTAGPIVSGKGNRKGGSDVTTTDRYGNAITLTGAEAGDVFTITDDDGNVITTTYGGGAGAIRSLVLQTKTLPNGERSTLTSVAVIVPTVEPGNTPTQGGQAATGTSPAPGLVSGSAARVGGKVGKEAIALVAGAAGVAWLL